jgi:hypothetical protein
MSATPPRKWAPLPKRWSNAAPPVREWAERRRIKKIERMLDDYLPRGLDELAELLAEDLDEIEQILALYAKIREIAGGLQSVGYFHRDELQKLELQSVPWRRTSSDAAARYDLVQLRRYEHACEAAGREIPWDEWARENPTSSEQRRGRGARKVIVYKEEAEPGLQPSDFACDECGAEPREPCRSPDGEPRAWHGSRRAKARSPADRRQALEDALTDVAEELRSHADQAEAAYASLENQDWWPSPDGLSDNDAETWSIIELGGMRVLLHQLADRLDTALAISRSQLGSPADDVSDD